MPPAEAVAVSQPADDSAQYLGQATTEESFELEIYMAFQPVVDVSARRILSHEALVRGPSGRSEATVMARVNPKNQFDFERKCRVSAMETASALGLKEDLSINFMPSAVKDPEDFLQQVQWTADEFDFPVDRIMLEYSEFDQPNGIAHLKEICRLTRRAGVRTIIDDFGAGQSSLLRLAALRPAAMKLDQAFVRRIDADPRRRSIIAGTQAVCLDLGIDLIAKGVETQAELDALKECGIDHYQGNFFAEPALEFVHKPADIQFGA